MFLCIRFDHFKSYLKQNPVVVLHLFYAHKSATTEKFATISIYSIVIKIN